MANGNVALIRRVLAIVALVAAVVAFIVPGSPSLDIGLGALAVAMLLGG